MRDREGEREREILKLGKDLQKKGQSKAGGLYTEVSCLYWTYNYIKYNHHYIIMQLNHDESKSIFSDI